jgi:hypothetical protein
MSADGDDMNGMIAPGTGDNYDTVTFVAGQFGSGATMELYNTGEPQGASVSPTTAKMAGVRTAAPMQSVAAPAAAPKAAATMAPAVAPTGTKIGAKPSATGPGYHNKKRNGNGDDGGESSVSVGAGFSVQSEALTLVHKARYTAVDVREMRLEKHWSQRLLGNYLHVHIDFMTNRENMLIVDKFYAQRRCDIHNDYRTALWTGRIDNMDSAVRPLKMRPGEAGDDYEREQDDVHTSLFGEYQSAPFHTEAKEFLTGILKTLESKKQILPAADPVDHLSMNMIIPQVIAVDSVFVQSTVPFAVVGLEFVGHDKKVESGKMADLYHHPVFYGKKPFGAVVNAKTDAGTKLIYNGVPSAKVAFMESLYAFYMADDRETIERNIASDINRISQSQSLLSPAVDSPFLVWVLTNLKALIKDFLAKNPSATAANDLMMTKDVEDNLAEFFRENDLASHTANLAGDALSDLVHILRKKGQLAWSVNENDTHYHMPHKFVTFAQAECARTLHATLNYVDVDKFGIAAKAVGHNRSAVVNSGNVSMNVTMCSFSPRAISMKYLTPE